eukprot:gene13523-14935_t
MWIHYCKKNTFSKKKTKLNEQGFILAKRQSRRHPDKVITDADYADDLALFSYTFAEAEKLLYALENAAAKVVLYVYECWKTEFTDFQNHDKIIRTENGTQLKWVEKFVYFGSDISLTENDVQIPLPKHGQH